MALQTIYPAKINSPAATLTSGATAGDTTIAVDYLEYFTSAPNLAVIGTGDGAETILYESMSGASGAGNLTSVTRGFQGDAKAWDADTTIARKFTAYDYDAICNNLTEHNHKLDDLTAPDDNTDLNASTSAHGLLPKLSDDSTEFLDGTGTWSTPAYPSSLFRNALINGNFDIWQRRTSFDSTTTPANNDDTYLMDRWILLSDGNDIVDVSREATVIPDGSAYSLKAEVETANKKFGILQIIEYVNAVKFAGKTVSLSFQAYTPTGAEIENIRAAVISWDGTADSVTSDVVSAWGSEGTNPTLATNWTYENTPTDLALVADTWTEFKIEGISVDTSGMKNLAVFIWCDDTDAAVNDIVRIAQVQLCEGDIALPFQPRSFDDELRACQRYYHQINTESRMNPGLCASSTSMRVLFLLPTTMRTIPSLTCVGTWDAYVKAGVLIPASFDTVHTNASDENGMYAGFTVSSGLTTGNMAILGSTSSGAYIGFDAEL